MRTDVRIGVAAVAIVVLGAVIYISARKPAEQKADQPADITNTSPSGAQPAGELPASPKDEQLIQVRVAEQADANAPAAAAPTTEPADAVKLPVVPPAPSEVPAVPPASVGIVIPATAPTEITPASPLVSIGPSSAKTYTVVKGDTIWKIAEKEYGDGKFYYLIADNNSNIDVHSLKVGQQIKIPPLPQSKAAVATVAEPIPASTSGQTVYVVQPGDAGLWGIAAKVYRDGSKYPIIAKANPGVDSTKLRVGQKLIIPALDSSKAVPIEAVSPTKTRTVPTAPARTSTPNDSASDNKPRFY